MSIIISGVGRVGKDAVVRNTGNGDAVTGFSLAMDNGWGDRLAAIGNGQVPRVVAEAWRILSANP